MTERRSENGKLCGKVSQGAEGSCPEEAEGTESTEKQKGGERGWQEQPERGTRNPGRNPARGTDRVIVPLSFRGITLTFQKGTIPEG
mgnify:CR=1 FL=1